MLKPLILTFLLSCLTFQTFADGVIKTIENKRTQELIQATCEEYESGACSAVSVRYHNPRKEIEEELAYFSNNLSVGASRYFESAAHEERMEELERNRYQFNKATDTLCRFQFTDKSHHDEVTFKRKCRLTLLLSALAGISIKPMEAENKEIPGIFAVAGLAGTAAFADVMMIPKVMLAPVAVVIDVARFFTVFPIKKLIGGLRQRRLRRDIVPLIQELNSEVVLPMTEEQLSHDSMNPTLTGRHVLVKRRVFKRVLRALRRVGESESI